MGESDLAKFSVISTYETIKTQVPASERKGTYNVSDEPLDQGLAGVLPDYDPKNLDLRQIRSEFIVGYDPAFGS